MGMRPIVIDAGEKKDMCMKNGAQAFVDFKTEKDVPAKVREIADGIGVHGVLVTAYQAYERECLNNSSNRSGLTSRKRRWITQATVKERESW